MSTKGQRYFASNTETTDVEGTVNHECNAALCSLLSQVSPAFANSVLFRLQQGFLKTEFFKEVDCLEEATTLFMALECFFRTYDRPESREYIKELAKENFANRLNPAI